MKKRLLIVDDEPSIQLILEHYFSSAYEVILHANGQEAIEWLQQENTPDAIIADYTMPVMDGLDFIKQVRASPRHLHIPLVMLSGKDETSIKIKCLKQGADDYVVKPFNPEELELRIKKLLARVKI
ncbi:response regulator transcription factor [Hymenobacter defluvii]|uniref:Response regulator n=1 Tax=Hymenobacter defluvii TaxID=2054411 RepID=A0ABS3TIH9_9BACT|nr:response regulator [Hymenobacter defluvii]MBO3273442.1 response regulator [Hymenobacter defluvii]